MQVILRNDVDHLGYSGDVVDVRKGYWRNYLRPKGLAEAATAGKIAEMVAKMDRRRAAEAQNATEAKELAELITRTTVIVSAQAGESGKLFGSVTTHEITRTLEATRKLRLDHRRLKLAEPIKAIGTFMVPVDLGHGVHSELTVTVTEVQMTDDERAVLASAAAQADADAIAAVEAAEAAEAAAAVAAAEAAAAPDEAADSATEDSATSADA
jgi:large subunit ribosomal protein L9